MAGFEPALPEMELNVGYAGEDAPGQIASNATSHHAMSRISFSREENPLRETGSQDQWV